MTNSKKRVAALISGRGSNMQALVRASRAEDYPAEITLVLSNRSDAAGLEFAEANNIKTCVIDHKTYGKDRRAFEEAMHAKLVDHDIEIVCLAGFMRLLTPWFVDQWHKRMLNIHPSLLPAFKGLNTHQRALDAGVKLHGATVHLVTPEMDVGPIILQKAVPVYPSDTEKDLAARVLEIEHEIYPKALNLIASGEAKIRGEKVDIPKDYNML
jgi:phosphoribosylglycinamide formyltransferase-1